MFKPMYQKIRKYMDEQGVSRKQVALSMKVSESKLSLILSGKRKLTVEEYLCMCKALSLPPQKFFDEN